MDAITPDALAGINQKLREAEKDTTPHAVVSEEEITVVGDANKTEKKLRNYTAKFRYDKSMADVIGRENISQEIGDYIIVEVEFKDVTVLPRNDLAVVSGIQEMLPFFLELRDNGELSKLTDKEAAQRMGEFSEEVMNAVYRVVEAFLGIDRETSNYLMAISAIDLLGQFITDFPEVFNEADVLFG